MAKKVKAVRAWVLQSAIDGSLYMHFPAERSRHVVPRLFSRKIEALDETCGGHVAWKPVRVSITVLPQRRKKARK